MSIVDKIAAILAEADLESLIKMGAPPDEYSPEAKVIAKCIEDGDEVTSELIEKIFHMYFSYDSHYNYSSLKEISDKVNFLIDNHE